MKMSCGCGFIIGSLLALLLCVVLGYFFYCRSNPDDAEKQFEQMKSGWKKVKHGGDKTIDYLKEKFVVRESDADEKKENKPLKAEDNPFSTQFKYE